MVKLIFFLCLFIVAIMLCDMKMQSTSIPMDSRGQGYLVILAKAHSSVVCQYFKGLPL